MKQKTDPWTWKDGLITYIKNKSAWTTWHNWKSTFVHTSYEQASTPLTQRKLLYALCVTSQDTLHETAQWEGLREPTPEKVDQLEKDSPAYAEQAARSPQEKEKVHDNEHRPQEKDEENRAPAHAERQTGLFELHQSLLHMAETELHQGPPRPFSPEPEFDLPAREEASHAAP
jgi:hypothetical protein